ncbi:early nodulin-like protein 1 [Solanum verrucosum]|uniref:early nodulin-like protein 1 n=1 Tax=Solanum verrucosum TaxID=315347 RepID=UPI0020D14A78|nr:early nodulin-like protein 1 [Solanum verrucosum]
MEFLLSQSYFFLIFLGFIMCGSFCEANHTFYAGGESGWVLNPSEPYSHWAERNRFQVNDTIVFKFELGSNSALFVYKEDYYNCNKEDPIVILDHGDSRFTFNGPGTFSFISGHEDNCEKGQKLMIVVLSPNHTKAQEAQTSLSPTPAESIGPVLLPAPTPAKSGAPAGFISWSFSISLMMIITTYLLCI